MVSPYNELSDMDHIGRRTNLAKLSRRHLKSRVTFVHKHISKIQIKNKNN